MKRADGSLVLAFFLLAALSLTAAPKAKNGFVKVLVQHGVNTSAPDQMLAGIDGEVVRRYESYTVVQMEQQEVQAFAERARQSGVEMELVRHYDQMFLPGAVTDARLGARGSHPGRLLVERYAQGREGLYVVQFVGPILPEWQESVKNAGAKVFTYVQFNALVVVANEAVAADLAALPHVQYCGVFQPFMKDQKAAKTAGQTREYLVHLADVPGVENDIRRILAWGRGTGEPRRGIEHELRMPVRLDGSRVDQVLALPLVVGISSPIRTSFSDERVTAAVGNLIVPITGQPRNRPHYQEWLSSVCPYCTNLAAENFYAGIADTGLNGGSGSGAVHHPDLPGTRIRWGANFNNPSNWYYSATQADLYGHGSAVAGVIGGSPASGGQTDEGGFFYGTGIAPSAGIFVTTIDAGQATVSGTVTSALVADASTNGVWVQNHSYNRYTHPDNEDNCAAFFDGLYEALAQEFDQSVIDTGVTITASAGNRDQQPTRPAGCGSPFIAEALTLPLATAKNVIAVGGAENVRGGPWPCHNSLSEDFDNVMTNSKNSTRYTGFASFSSKWYIKPDLFAPASRVAVHRSTAAPPPLNFCSASGPGVPLGTGDLYIGGTGTSFAAPVAAGAALLASRRYAETAKVNGQPVPGAAKPSLVKAMLIAGADSMYGGSDSQGAFDPAPNSRQGFGRLSLDRVISQYPARVYVNETANLPSVSSSWSRTFKVHDPALPVTVVLAWTDPAGMPPNDNGTPLVNDLDLLVEIGAPCSGRYTGNDLIWNTWREEEVSREQNCTATSADRANNVEMVKFYPPAGLAQFTVQVRATTGNMTGGSPQKFSAVIYNAGDPADTFAPLTPASLAATAFFTGTTWSADLAWPSVSGATGYEIHVSTNGTHFTQAGTSATNSFTHHSLAPSTSYLYKVRAVGAAGKSDFTSLDPATTVAFTDGDLTNARIRAAHITELRTAASALRAAAGLPGYTFTDLALTVDLTPLKALHLAEVRTAIDAARDSLGLARSGNILSESGSLISRAAVVALREGVQ